MKPEEYNIRRPLGPLLGSSRDLAATPEEWLYTVLPSAQPSGRPSLSHVGRLIICSHVFGATKAARFLGDHVQVCFCPLFTV